MTASAFRSADTAFTPSGLPTGNSSLVRDRHPRRRSPDGRAGRQGRPARETHRLSPWTPCPTTFERASPAPRLQLPRCMTHHPWTRLPSSVTAAILASGLLVLLAAGDAWADLFGGDIPLLGTLVTQGTQELPGRRPAHPHRQRAARRGEDGGRVRRGGEGGPRPLPALLRRRLRRRRPRADRRRRPRRGREPAGEWHLELGPSHGRAPDAASPVSRLGELWKSGLPADARRHHPGGRPAGPEPRRSEPPGLRRRRPRTTRPPGASPRQTRTSSRKRRAPRCPRRSESRPAAPTSTRMPARSRRRPERRASSTR